MTNYRNYTVENFLTDVLFRAWVLNDDPQAAAFWQHWLADNPDRSEIVEEARAFLLAITERKQSLSDEELDEIVEATLGKIRSEAAIAPPIGRRLFFVLTRVAAAIIVVAGLGWLVHKFPVGAPFGQPPQNHHLRQPVWNAGMTRTGR